MTEIAAAEGIDLGQASKMSRLAQLSPDLIEAIALGRLEVGVIQLLRGKLSASWLAQREALVQARADFRAAATRRHKAVFLCLSLSRSRAPEQAKKQTDGPQTRANTRLQALNAQEGSRKQREKNGGMRAEKGNFGRAMLKRPRPETAPTLAFRAKKIPTDKGWDFGKWWRMVDPVPTGLPSL